MAQPDPAQGKVTWRDAVPSFSPRTRLRVVGVLLLLTFAALLVHGYHPYAEDAEIYVPGVVQALHPSYYPTDRAFFQSQTNLTLFTGIVVWSARLTRLPLAWVFFLWQLGSIFLLLLACWKISAKCFPTAPGRWGAVAMVAALLTMPISGTSLYVLDQYFNPRSISAFAVLFAIDAMLEKKYWRAGLWLVFTALVHPLMAVFGVTYLLLFYALGRAAPAWAALCALLAIPGLSFQKPSAAYYEILAKRPGLFLLHWQWYEWLGAIAPPLLLAWFARVARGKQRPTFARLASTMALFGAIYFVGAFVTEIPRSLVDFIRFQPMRSLFLVYLFLILFIGGFLGELILKAKPLRWLLLLVPLCAGMAYAQFQLFPGNQHIEWPGARPRNPWEQAFLWIRGHTPTDAVFALDPYFMDASGEDHQGFRALAERSRLADALKDWSVATLYPATGIADRCLAQVKATAGLEHFTPQDFERLRKTYGVTWVVLQQPGNPGLACPYRNSAVVVCRLGTNP